MRKLVVSEWITLDGVFDADTMKDWFAPFDSVAKNAYIRESISAADALLVGSTTYDMLSGYWSNEKNDDNGPASKMNSMKKFVVSDRIKKAGWNNTTVITNDIVGKIRALKQESGNEIQIPGSASLVQSLMKEALIDEFRFLIHPVIIGSGRRFFKDGMNTSGMDLVKTKPLDKGVVLLCYQSKTK